MLKRLLEDRICDKLTPNKAVLLFGARRVGKTVLMRQVMERFAGKKLVLNGEDFDTLSLLEPQSVANYRRLLDGVELLAIDEAQNIPGIGQKLKLIVDEIPGIKVLATGSSSFDLLNRAGEPLVGRSTQFHLFPFSQAEISQVENALQTRQNLEDRLVLGSYPEVINLSGYQEKKDYLHDMVNAYLLKDILSVDGLKNSAKMLGLLRLVAFQTGSEVSYDELGRQLGLTRITVEKYLDLLSKVFVVFRLSGFSRNLRKEISKSAKWYFYDNGIRNALIGGFSAVSQRNDIGQLWENYLISERIKQSSFLGLDRSYYFWRTYDGQEIDLIEESENRITATEFKWGDKTRKAPRAFSTNYPEAAFSVITRENYLEFIATPLGFLSKTD
jgi:predicted AAA+ superfamily ATPase